MLSSPETKTTPVAADSIISPATPRQRVQRVRSKSKPRRSTSRSRSRSRSRKSTTPKSPEDASKPTRRTYERKAKSAPASPAPETPTRQSKRLQEKLKLAQPMETETLKANDSSSEIKSAKPEVNAISFGGSIGGAILTVALPSLVIYIALLTDKRSGFDIFRLPYCPGTVAAFFNTESFALVGGWYLLHVFYYYTLPGKTELGQPLRHSGKRLPYNCNGLSALLASVCLFLTSLYFEVPLSFLPNNWLPIVMASITYSTLLAVWMYAKALRAPQDEIAPESTGNFFNDFWMGRELNPRIGIFDFKFFFELRPGLIGWMLIDWTLLTLSYQKSGVLPPALTMVVLFQTIYVFDALKNEAAILTTTDIITEGFGFMLAFGDLAWVPLLYTLQALYLYLNPGQAVTHPAALASILALEVGGYYIFRGANSQKDLFRNDPGAASLKGLATIETGLKGKELLAGGFWGICRRPNYLGDLMMATAWSLPCGFSHILPYFYPVSFLCLLIHRCLRDEAHLSVKYGAAWTKYTQRVPYRIFPYIF